MKILENRLDELRQRIKNVPRVLDGKIDETARNIARKVFQEIQSRQPDGSQNPDLLVTEGGYAGRSVRPSVRQGNDPIAHGWVGPTITKVHPGVRLIEIESRSPHIEFFTMWTGRPYLGTQPGRSQVARNAKTLAFWWQKPDEPAARAHFPEETRGHGFSVDRDFVQDAWLASKDYIDQETRDLAIFSLVKAFE